MPNYTEQDFLNNLNYLNNTKNLMREAIINKGVEVNVDDTFRSYAYKIDNIVDVTDPSNVVTGYKFNSVADMNGYNTTANIGDYALVSGKSYVHLSSTGYYLNCTLIPIVTFPNTITANSYCNGSGSALVNKFWCNVTPTDIKITVKKSKTGSNVYYNYISNDGKNYTFDVDNSADIGNFTKYNIVINNYAPEVNYIILGRESVSFNGVYSLNSSRIWAPLPTQLNTSINNILNTKTAYTRGATVTGTAFNTIYTWDTNTSNETNAKNFIDSIQPIVTGINAVSEPIDANNLFNNYKGHYIPPIKVKNLSRAMYNATNLVISNIIPADNIPNLNMYYAFYNCTNLQCIDSNKVLKIGDATYTFFNCTQLSSVPDIEFQGAMTNTFYNCKNVGMFKHKLNTSNVFYFDAPFYNSDISTSDIFGFDFSNAKSLIKLFSNKSMINYTGANIALLPNINLSNVTSLYGLYYNCYMRSTTEFDTHSVQNISMMYCNCPEFTYLPNYNFCNVINAYDAFHNCINLSSVSNWNLVRLSDATYMFSCCINLKSVYAWNTANLTNAARMFNNCTVLYNVPAFNTRKTTDFAYMFNNCINLYSAPAFVTPSAMNFASMFYNCTRLYNVPVYNASNVTYMSSMFSCCNNLSNTSIHNIINTCLSTTKLSSSYKNLNTSNTYSPLYNTKFTSTYYSNRLSELTSAGWNY